MSSSESKTAALLLKVFERLERLEKAVGPALPADDDDAQSEMELRLEHIENVQADFAEMKKEMDAKMNKFQEMVEWKEGPVNEIGAEMRLEEAEGSIKQLLEWQTNVYEDLDKVIDTASEAENTSRRTKRLARKAK